VTIVEFLEARLAEDERAAHAAPPASGGPPRAGAEAAAKRRVLGGYVAAYRACSAALLAGPTSVQSVEAVAALYAWRSALEHLAAVYAGHPDYDPSWRP
jgi:hypothetical protein